MIVPGLMWACIMGSRVAADRSGTICINPGLVYERCRPFQTPKSHFGVPYCDDTAEGGIFVQYKCKEGIVSNVLTLDL